MFTAAALPTKKIDLADVEEIHLELTGPAAYTAGGEDFLADAIPFRVGVDVHAVSGRSQSGDFWLLHDRANSKLKVFVAATGVEVAGAVDLSAEVFDAAVLGR